MSYNPSQRLSEWAADFLSPYINLEGADVTGATCRSGRSSLSVGLWSGNVELKNVELRPDAIENILNSGPGSADGQSIRWKLLRGNLECIKIAIPWKSLLVRTSYSSSPADVNESMPGDDESSGVRTSKSSTELGNETGYTVVKIQGVEIQLGYEIVDSTGSCELTGGGQTQDADSGLLKEKIFEERNRILLLAERRLFAGLEPFPPTLTGKLRSLVGGTKNSGSCVTNGGSSARSRYFSRLEKFVSSTIKALLWRVFDSLSVSISQMDISIAGPSHYDKGFNSFTSPSRPPREENKQRGKNKRPTERHFRLYSFESQSSPRNRAMWQGDRSNVDAHAKNNDTGALGLNLAQKLDDSPQVWAREGNVEFGIIVDTLDVNPSTKSGDLATRKTGALADDRNAQCDSRAVKLITGGGIAVYLSRNTSQDDTARGDTDKKEALIDKDDYLLGPFNLDACCRVTAVAASQEQTTVTLTSSDFESPSDVSFSTNMTRRRGKRERRGRAMSTGNNGNQPMISTQSSVATAPPQSDLNLSANSPPCDQYKVELTVKLGHICSNISPRQVYLLNSFSASMMRLRRGRPNTSIRSARLRDASVRRQLAESGESLLDWQSDHIYREVPGLRPAVLTQPQRTLPRVVSSWWRYAFFNILRELNEREELLSNCRGDPITEKSRRLTQTLQSRRLWNWTDHSQVRKEYIALSLTAQRHSTAGTNAAEAAKLRLQQLDRSLSLERVLLLKNVARAACVCQGGGTSIHVQPVRGLSTPDSAADMYYYFPPSSRGEGGAIANESTLEVSTAALDDDDIVGGSLDRSEKDGGSPTNVLGPVTHAPKTSLNFTASVSCAGLSLSVCEFIKDAEPRLDVGGEIIDGATDPFDMDDEISALTGFSFGSTKTDRESPGELFNPSCRFWPTKRHGISNRLLMVFHLPKIKAMIRGKGKELEHKLSFGSISIGSGMGRDILVLDQSFSDDPASCSLPAATVRMQGPEIAIKLGSIESRLDWKWAESLFSFFSSNGDMRARRTLDAFKDEEFVRRVLNGSTRVPPGKPYTLTAEMDSVSLSVPMKRGEANASAACDDKQLLFTCTKISAVKSSGRALDTLESRTDSVYVGDLDCAILSKTESDTIRTGLLKRPITLKYSPSQDEAEFPGTRHFFEISPLSILLSESRIRSLLCFANTFLQAPMGSDRSPDFQQELIPELSGSTLSRAEANIQSVDIHFLPQDDELIASFQSNPQGNNYLVRQQLQDAVTTFLWQLSHLDYQFPNRVAVACLKRITSEQLEVVGLSAADAAKCIELATKRFFDEAQSYSSRIQGQGRGLKRRSSRRYTISGAMTTFAPTSFSNKIDHIIGKVTATVMASIEEDSAFTYHSEKDVLFEGVSLTVKGSSLYCGSLLQLELQSANLRKGTMKLLSLDSLGQAKEDPQQKDYACMAAVRLGVSGQEVSLETGRIDVRFMPDECFLALTRIERICEFIITSLPPKSSAATAKATGTSLSFVASADLVSLVLMDRLFPFAELRLGNATLDLFKTLTESRTKLEAADISLDCLTSTAYSSILSTIQSEDLVRTAFSLQIREIGLPESRDVTVCLDSVRIVVLRQLIHEIVQYLSSPSYGLGLYRSYFPVKEQGSKPSSSSPRVVATRSSIILPRDSESVDLVGVEVERLSITIERVIESWTTGDYSFSAQFNPGEFPPATNQQHLSNEFYDCVDENHLAQAGTEAGNDELISRYSITLESGRIFTALNRSRHSLDKVDLPQWHSEMKYNDGRIEQGKSPYLSRADSGEADSSDIMHWEEVTQCPLELNIFADFASALRLFIGDTPNATAHGVHLDMRMSQLYLLISLWYCNMQELPFLLPFDHDFIVKHSRNPEPPRGCWPEYGSPEFVSRIDSEIPTKTFEMSLCFRELKMRCTYDPAKFFPKDPEFLSLMEAEGDFLSIILTHAICGIESNADLVTRVGLVATSFSLSDGRVCSGAIPQEIQAKGESSSGAPLNMSWGLKCGRSVAHSGLPSPFQLTVFLTPDNHCMVNLGIDKANATLANINPIWILLEYFGLYFQDGAYGHPLFLAQLCNRPDDTTHVDDCDDRLKMDFRLWLANPNLVIPSRAGERDEMCIMLETDGLYYRYRSFDSSYSSQEILANGLAIVVLSNFVHQSSRGLRQVSGSVATYGYPRTLVDDLSFSAIYDYNSETNYTRFTLSVPPIPARPGMEVGNGIEHGDTDVKPFCIPSPTVCKPFLSPSRTTCSNEDTHVYISYEYMKVAADYLLAFISPPNPKPTDQGETAGDQSHTDNIFSVVVHVERLKFIISDPVLGMHRPIMAICIPELDGSLCQLKDQQIQRVRSKQYGCFGPVDRADELQASVESTLYLDYFKLGLTRNWEPLVEPFHFLILYEKSKKRGDGVTFSSDCPLHLNFSSALVETIDDAINGFDLFQQLKTTPKPGINVPRLGSQSDPSFKTTSEERRGPNRLTVLHSEANLIRETDRVAYSLRNSTGERIRIHVQSAHEIDLRQQSTTVAYLDYMQLMPLSFPATHTIIRNLCTVEVPFRGDQNVGTYNQARQGNAVLNHEVDIQIPSYRWTRGVSLDRTGKYFVPIVPRSILVQRKVSDDWRLTNALHILAEVKSINGGRRLTIKSPFQVVNKTNHSIILATNPDPTFSPSQTAFQSASALEKPEILQEKSGDTSEVVDGVGTKRLSPDEVCNLSFYLIDSALHLNGNHLGSVWIRPDQTKCNQDRQKLFDSNSSCLESVSQSTVEFPPRPLQLAKVVHESAVIYKGLCDDPDRTRAVATSGTEVSCPVFDKDKARTTTQWCYVVEMNRSPLVPSKQAADPPDSPPAHSNISDTISDILSSPAKVGKQGLKSAKNIFTRSNSIQDEMHAPVEYTLVIHPPIVIENLLPERGRFELMDGNTRNVLWWAILEPGEIVPVHTVGLDSPLLLLVNFVYCKTIGDGALVHRGEAEGILRAGWNTIGTAVKTSRDRVKKTLNTITDTKDNRGVTKFNMLQAGGKTPAKGEQLGFSSENDSIIESTGLSTSARRISGDGGFGSEDVASELTVVDSQGQKLTLLLDNESGRGGQRRVSVYCPFWIVNTTEHSLKYKQEKATSFPSGTVIENHRDGSKPVDGSNRIYGSMRHLGTTDPAGAWSWDSLHLNTVFPGRPGALSMIERSQEGTRDPALLAAMISEDLPLGTMCKLAFMFNFQEESLSLGGPPRLCLQLSEGKKYVSNFSSGFVLESIGVTQIVGMLCKGGRSLEVSVSISIAPGRLSKYTKIVRICPRYIMVNQLHNPIVSAQRDTHAHGSVFLNISCKRLWQDNSVTHHNLALDHSAQSTASTKWRFVDAAPSEGVINEYELLFGMPTPISSQACTLEPQTTAHHEASFVANINPDECRPFHLPDTRIDRLLRLDIGPSWYLSPSFSADITGQVVLPMSGARDLRLLPHVNSRGSAYYSVIFPPPPNEVDWNGELGVFFESDWDFGQKLIVKGIRDGSYASYFTDITVGDALIMIDSEPVEDFSFDQAIKHLKSRLAAAKDSSSRDSLARKLTKKMAHRGSDPCISDSEKEITITLTFLTLEERLRRLRLAAVSTNEHRLSDEDKLAAQNVLATQRSTQIDDTVDSMKLLVDLKFFYQTVFIFVKPPDPTDPPHKIINRSLHWAVFFRQKGCDGHPWKCLDPGESTVYTWEEPMRSKKLSVKVGTGDWMDSTSGHESSTQLRDDQQGKKKRKRPIFSFQFIENEEQGNFGPTETIRLEEIGYMNSISCPMRRGKVSRGGEESLLCQVDTEGSCRVLIINDEMPNNTPPHNNLSLMTQYISNLRHQVADEEDRRAQLIALKNMITPMDVDGGMSVVPNSIEAEEGIKAHLPDLVSTNEGHFISRQHQVVVEVLEATGLRSDLDGLANPYVKVTLASGKTKTAFGLFAQTCHTRHTYYMEKTLSPQWSHQSFVFDVPENAADDPRATRRLTIQCVVKSIEKFGNDVFLGQTQVHLRNIINQQEHVGWYPLQGKIGQGDSRKDEIDKLRGSIKLRVQWVHDIRGLISYYISSSDHRLESLRKVKNAMKTQLKSIKESERQKREEEEGVVGIPALAKMYARKTHGSVVEPHSEKKLPKPSDDGKARAKAVGKFKKSVMNRVLATTRLASRSEYATETHMASAESLLDFSDEEFSDEELSRDHSTDSSNEEGGYGGVVPALVMTTDVGVASRPSFEVGNIFAEGNTGIISPNLSQQKSSSSHNERFVRIRWRNWQKHNPKNEPLVHTSLPFCTSWNTCRAVVNRDRINPTLQTPALLSNTDNLIVEDDDDILAMIEFLKPPPAVPSLLQARDIEYIRSLMKARKSFSKAARRSLGSVLNPGGVLTIRPITALNLPEGYTGMFVKLRYGTTVCASETVDSKVTPRWTDEESLPKSNTFTMSASRSRRFVRQGSQDKIDSGNIDEVAEWWNPTRAGARENVLRISVDPFETSRSLRLTVIGEKLQSRMEIGVLEIPLGPALECCAQSMEDYNEDATRKNPQGLAPAYVRWFPLMSPSEVVPVEGDMGQSQRHKESEQKRDDAFAEYFAPCIKLALMFHPTEGDNRDAAALRSTNTTQNYLYANMSRLSAAVIDSSRAMELLSFVARDVDVRISITSAKTRYAFAVGGVQIDQQAIRSDSKVPVVLCPTPVKQPQPTIQFLAWKDNIRSKPGIDFLDYIALQVQELDLKIEESWLFDVLEFYLSVTERRQFRASVWDQHSQKDSSRGTTFKNEESIASFLERATVFLQDSVQLKSRRIYVRQLLLGYMRINLSYFKSGKNTWNPVESDEALGDDIFSTPSLLPSASSVRGSEDSDAYRQWQEERVSNYGNLNLISAVFPTISEAPIRFPGRQINHVYEAEGDIWRSLRSFYSAEALKQIYKLVGSLDFVGNPTMVLTSFRTGIVDFFLQPSRELKHITRNPSRVGVGMLKGTLSLLSHSASGIFGFAHNVGATIGHTATILTLDEEFQRLHSEQKAAQQRHYDRWKKKGFGHATLMVSRPLHDIGFAVVSASTGLIMDPYRGAVDGGAVGLAKGTAVGVIGVVVKPIVGLADAFSHVMESIHDLAKSVSLDPKYKSVERYRLPYVFGPSRMLLPFCQVDSRSAQLLISHPLKKEAKHGEEVIIASEALNVGTRVDKYIVITSMRACLFKVKVVDGQGFMTSSIEWQVIFDESSQIKCSLGNKGHSGFILVISRYSQGKKGSLSEAAAMYCEESSERFGASDLDVLSLGDRGSKVDMPKSAFYPSGVGFRLLPWPTAPTEGEHVTRFVVEGNGKQRQPLIRIHNAVCCLVGDFESLIREGHRRNGTSDITSFCELMTFERPGDPTRAVNRAVNRDDTFLLASLEESPWTQLDDHSEPSEFGLPPDESCSNIPAWLLKARERAHGESFHLTSINVTPPRNDSVSAITDDGCGFPTNRSSLPLGRSNSLLRVVEIDDDDADDFNNEEFTTDIRGLTENPVAASNKTSYHSALTSSDTRIPNGFSIQVKEGINERLIRVEHLLEQLVGGNGQQSVAAFQVPQANANEQNDVPDDVTSLQREVKELRRQLAEKTTANLPVDVELSPETPSIKKSRRIGKRLRGFFMIKKKK